MFPLIAGAVTLVLLSLYCWWIGDELAEERADDGAVGACSTPYQHLEEQRIPVTDWPTSASPNRRGAP